VDVGFPAPSTAGFDGQRIVAIGDVNGDKWLDVVTTNTGGNEVTVNYYDKEAQTYVASEPFPLEYSASNTTKNLSAANVVITKYNQKLQSLMVVA